MENVGADANQNNSARTMSGCAISYCYLFTGEAIETQGVSMHRSIVIVLSGLLLAGFVFASYAAYSGLLSMPGWGAL